MIKGNRPRASGSDLQGDRGDLSVLNGHHLAEVALKDRVDGLGAELSRQDKGVPLGDVPLGFGFWMERLATPLFIKQLQEFAVAFLLQVFLGNEAQGG
jgi:hypothetical protein